MSMLMKMSMMNEEIFKQYTGPAALIEEAKRNEERDRRLRERELALQEDVEKRKQIAGTEGIVFDSLNGVLRYGNTFHKLQKGAAGDKRRLELFRKLWEEKKVSKQKVATSPGKPFPPEALAVQIGLIASARQFPSAKAKFYALVKGIQRVLREKRFPARIERKNGVQLVIEEL